MNILLNFKFLGSWRDERRMSESRKLIMRVCHFVVLMKYHMRRLSDTNEKFIKQKGLNIEN